MQPYYEYNESILVDRQIIKYSTPKTLTALGATLDFIDIWIKLFFDHYSARCDAYVNDMKEMFKQILLTTKKHLLQNKSINL